MNVRGARAPVFSLHYRIADFFLVRTPLLEFESLFSLADHQELSSGSRYPGARFLAIADRLRLLARDPAVREAIEIASPEFSEQLERWLDPQAPLSNEKVILTVAKYVARMAFRATPYGLFAGTWLARKGSYTALRLDERRCYRRLARLDLGVLYRVTDALARRESVRRRIPFGVNTSLYKCGNHWHYVERRLVRSDGQVEYALSSVEASDVLDTIFAIARHGATVDELAGSLEHQGASLAEARAFVYELIDNDLLVSQLDAPLTGSDSLEGVLERCRRWIPEEEVVSLLSEIAKALNELNSLAPGAGLGSTRRLRTLIDQLPSRSAEDQFKDRLDIQLRPVANDRCVGVDVIEAIEGGVSALARIAAARASDVRVLYPEIGRFIDGFIDRYGAGEWIPLGQALDDETGLGFAGAWSRAQPMVGADGGTGPTALEAQWNKTLYRLVAAAIANHSPAIELTSLDLPAREEAARPHLSDAMMALVSISARSQEEINSRNFQVGIMSCAGASSVAMFGRFCHGDQVLTDLVRQQIQHEERCEPNATHAEIVHLPHGRMGNVIARPVLRGYEIVYLGAGGAPASNQVELSDLLVTVTRSRVLLWSKRLGSRIIPCLSCAHAAQQAAQLPVYRFLHMVQSHGNTQLAWNWGPLFDFPFLPKVTYGRAVLTPARWRLGAADLEPITGARGDEIYARVDALRAQVGLPRWLVLHANQNELPIDLENAVSVRCLAQELRRVPEATLLEMFPPPEARWLKGTDGTYRHEVMVSLSSADPRPEDTTFEPPSPLAARRVTFLPGSEWLYVKLYGGVASADRILYQVLLPVVNRFTDEPWFRSWFFIRYGDPEPHIRFRVHGAPEELQRYVLAKLRDGLDPWIANGSVSKVQLDTYVREVSRYGGDAGITIAERLFEADSVAVARIMEVMEDRANDNERRLIALQGVDRLLAAFKLDLTGRAELMLRIKQDLVRDSSPPTSDIHAVRRRLAAYYRQWRPRIDAILNGDVTANQGLRDAEAAFRERSEALRPIVEDLQMAERQQQLTRRVMDLVPSYLHMHVNRIMKSDHSRHEIMIYDALAQSYSSQIARLRRAHEPTAGARSRPSDVQPESDYSDV